MEKEKIYQVTTEGDCEGKSTRTLGYCKGEISDIKAYFDDKKTYEIRVSEINVSVITSKSAEEKQLLMSRKKSLERQLEDIKKQLE